jgi:protocatechuate 3,4-dioxygenase beta subunit
MRNKFEGNRAMNPVHLFNAALRSALVSTAAAVVLVGCGGSGAGAGGSNPVNPGSSVDSLRVELSNTVLSSNSKDAVTVTVTAKDATNRVVANQPISISAADPQNSIDVTQSSLQSDSSGVVTATLKNVNNPTNRQVTITATSGTKTGQVILDIVGTAVALSGPTTITSDTDATFTVSVKASDGTPLASRQVSLASARGNTVTPASTTTDASGQAKFAVRASAAAGVDTLTASSSGATSSQSVTAAGETLQIVTPADAAEIAINTSQAFTVRYTNLASGSSGKTVAFTSTRGTVSAGSQTTDAQGQASVTVSSSAAGPATISATVGGITTQRQVEFVSKDPATLSLQINPSTIQLNIGTSTTSRSTLSAQVLDANNNPVKGSVVQFTAVVDPSGGQIEPATAVTNSAGIATVSYIAGPRSTSLGGVQIQAAIQSAPASCVAGCRDTKVMTVAGNALFIAIGTGNKIESVGQETSYEIKYNVRVSDAAGNPVKDAAVTANATPTSDSVFLKGYWGPTSSVAFGQVITTSCVNEDFNLNGVIDGAEDRNVDGRLQPGNNVTVTSTGTTDALGEAILSLRYAKEFAYWYEVKLTVNGSVAGSGGGTASTQKFFLPGAISDYTGTIAPPGRVAQGCFDPVTSAFVSDTGANGQCTSPAVLRQFVVSPFGKTPNCQTPN